jgi:enamine deaminase RidA (YjgF/YER057c/UK114 family)
MAQIKIFNPSTMNVPRSPYFQIAQAKADQFVFIAGQVALDETGALRGEGDFEAQCQQVFANIRAALEAVGAGWTNVLEFTSYLVRPEDVPSFTAYRNREYPRIFPDKVYPPNTLLVISRLANPAYLLEVQTIAAL